MKPGGGDEIAARAGAENSTVAVALAGASLVAELAALRLVHADTPDWPAALAIHLGWSAVLLAVLWLRARRGRHDRFLAVLAVTVPLVGPLAPALTLILWPFYAWFKRMAVPFAQWYRELFPEAELSLPMQVYQSISRRGPADRSAGPVISYTDVMNHGTIEQRIAVIATVTRNFRPVFAPVLRQGMADPNPEIRVQAASAIAKLTDDFLKRVQRQEAALARRPGDIASLQALARAYDDYAFTGILEAEHEEHNRLRALDLWTRYCEAAPDDAEARVSVGRLLMRLDRLAMAAQWFERAIAEGRASSQALLWYMECLYRLGRTEALRAVAQTAAPELAQNRRLSANAVSAARFWAAQPEPAAAPARS